MSLFNELKRRNVFRVGAAYAILAWLLIQIIDTVLPTFDAPRWIIQTVTFLIILGFPVTLFLAWVFELTPEGLKKDAQAKADQAISQNSSADFSRVKSNTLNAMILGLVVLAVGFLMLDRFVIGRLSEAGTPAASNTFQGETQRVSLVLPEENPMVFGGTPEHALAISPDGQTIAYVALDITTRDSDLSTFLNVRHLNSLETRSLPGTENARQPFFSPDGQWLGFFTREGDLKKVALSGGTAVTLVEDINGGYWSRGTWLANGNIVFTPNSNPPVLQSVSENGGEVTVLVQYDPSERNNVFAPHAIPDTDIVLFSTSRQVENQIITSLESLNTTTGERRTILDGAAESQYLDSGHLLFKRNQILMIAPFDPEQLVFTGPAVPITDKIRRDGGVSQGLVPQLAVARNGTLAYAPAMDLLKRIYLVSRDGSSEALDLRPDNYDYMSVSRDGQIAAIELGRSGIETQIRLYNFARGTTSRLSQAESDRSPSWHPDGQSIAVSSPFFGNPGLYLKTLDGDERLLVETPPGTPALRNTSWHPDGNHLAVTRQDGDEHDIMLLTLDAENDSEITLEPLLTGPSVEHSPRFSPDGGWLAYVSDKSGEDQVYIRRYPEGEELMVSTELGAGAPAWSRDGSELFFVQFYDTDDWEGRVQLAAVTVSEVDDRLDVSQSNALFSLRQRSQAGTDEIYAPGSNVGNSYAVLPDGRFLMARSRIGRIQNEIVLVQNWFSELQDMAPVE